MVKINKIVLLGGLFLFSINMVYASDEVYLDVNIPEVHKFDVGQLKYENKKSDIEEDEDYLKPSIQNMKKMFDEDFYKSKTVSTTKEKTFGKNTVGAKYDTTLNTESVTQKRTLFAKRKLTEKMSVDTSYKSDLSGGLNTQTKGTVSVAPEYQFSKKAFLRNEYSKNLGDKSNKAELQLKYRPFKDDRMDLNVGAGQRMYDNGQQSSSQINFGTNIRF